MARTRKQKSFPKWSIYKALDSEVSRLLADTGLAFDFHTEDNETRCIKQWDSNVMGRFVCHNQACRSKGWSSVKIAITIRQYTNHEYNARVYHQRCKSCSWLSKPLLDYSYAERVVYWLKKWNGVYVERPDISRSSKGPHDSALCEGCKAGHCSQDEDSLSKRFNRFVSLSCVRLLTDFEIDCMSSRQFLDCRAGNVDKFPFCPSGLPRCSFLEVLCANIGSQIIILSSWKAVGHLLNK
ncbi:unnamed protein product [Penicillium olsonii]|nr:unnamed protein product [Penicillium olsonii]CAG7922668.1 unnamed protein product [Penicillium olsonii]